MDRKSPNARQRPHDRSPAPIERRWEKLRENDRVKVTYRTGNYTGTVWDAEIEWSGPTGALHTREPLELARH